MSSKRLAFPKSVTVSAVFLLGISTGVLGLPLWRTVLVGHYGQTYGELTRLCDSAMRSHVLTKGRLAENPTKENVDALKRSEIALIDCQDYDILQKRLMILGLRENELAYLRLLAIEADAQGLKDVIDAHEIRN
jgi:hypothetical protein